mgnify:FL=1
MAVAMAMAMAMAMAAEVRMRGGGGGCKGIYRGGECGKMWLVNDEV